MSTEIIVVICTIIGLIISQVIVFIEMFKVAKKNIQEFENISNKVIQNERDIEQHKLSFNRECLTMKENMEIKLEQVKQDRNERIAMVYRDINNIKDDVQTNHREIIQEIKTLSSEVAKLIGAFEESKKYTK